jgi:hypothetical protein
MEEGLRAEAAAFKQRRMELKLLNARHQRDGANGALHTTVAAPAPQTTTPTRPLTDDRHRASLQSKILPLLTTTTARSSGRAEEVPRPLQLRVEGSPRQRPRPRRAVKPLMTSSRTTTRHI